MHPFISIPLRAMALLPLWAWGAAHADYVWLERAANGALQARAGELGQPVAAFPDLKSPRAYLADGKDLAAAPEGGAVNIASPAAGDVRYVGSQAGSKGVLTIYQAKYGRSETRAANDLELVPTEPNGTHFKLVWKGQNVTASQVNVETSEGWRRVLKPGKDGTVSLAVPFPGLYVLEVTARVNGSVTVDGVKYEDVRHTATLSFEVGN